MQVLPRARFHTFSEKKCISFEKCVKVVKMMSSSIPPEVVIDIFPRRRFADGTGDSILNWYS